MILAFAKSHLKHTLRKFNASRQPRIACLPLREKTFHAAVNVDVMCQLNCFIKCSVGLSSSEI